MQMQPSFGHHSHRLLIYIETYNLVSRQRTRAGKKKLDELINFEHVFHWGIYQKHIKENGSITEHTHDKDDNDNSHFGEIAASGILWHSLCANHPNNHSPLIFK